MTKNKKDIKKKIKEISIMQLKKVQGLKIK